MVDEPLQDLGEKLRTAAQQSGADAVLTVMSPRATDGSEPPAPVAEALAACDVFIAPASRSLSHTLARKRASEAGARGATMPHVTADMLARLMSIDFDRLRSRSHAIADLLDKGTEAHVTCPRGTDLRLDLRGRQGIADDGDLTAPGAFGNLPCGEGFIAPAGGEGTMYARSIAAIGLTRGHPAKLTVENGHLTAATGPEGEQLLGILRSTGTRAPTSPSSGSARTIARPSRATSSRTRRSSGASTSPSARASLSAARSPCRSTSTASSPRRRSRSTARACWTRAASSSPPDATELPWSGEMAQTKRKRRTKHRGNAAGIVEVRGRTTRPASPEARKAQKKGDARKARMDRYAKPPSWRSAANRASSRRSFRRGHHLRLQSARQERDRPRRVHAPALHPDRLLHRHVLLQPPPAADRQEARGAGEGSSAWTSAPTPSGRSRRTPTSCAPTAPTARS